MAKNFVQPGNVITLPAPAGGIKSGAPIMVGAVFGIAAYDAAAAEPVEVNLTGVWDLPKDGTALDQGGPAYFDAAASKITSTAAGNWLIGAAIETAGASVGTARVRLGAVAIEQAGS